MARKDWYYMPIEMDQADSLQYIFEQEGSKKGYKDRIALARKILGDFIDKYEEKHGPIRTRKAVRTPKNTDVQKAEGEN